MTPEEVRLMINGWLENQSQLVLIANVSRFAVAVRCRVTRSSDFWVELSTVDNGKLAVGLFDPAAIFKYTEPREFSDLSTKLGLSAAQRFASSVTAMLPSEDESLESESIMLMELVD